MSYLRHPQLVLSWLLLLLVRRFHLTTSWRSSCWGVKSSLKPYGSMSPFILEGQTGVFQFKVRLEIFQFNGNLFFSFPSSIRFLAWVFVKFAIFFSSFCFISSTLILILLFLFFVSILFYYFFITIFKIKNNHFISCVSSFKLCLVIFCLRVLSASKTSWSTSIISSSSFGASILR